jgi:hypothetical protein
MCAEVKICDRNRIFVDNLGHREGAFAHPLKLAAHAFIDHMPNLLHVVFQQFDQTRFAPGKLASGSVERLLRQHSTARIRELLEVEQTEPGCFAGSYSQVALNTTLEQQQNETTDSDCKRSGNQPVDHLFSFTGWIPDWVKQRRIPLVHLFKYCV